jgi:hypothetical protein
MRSMKGLPSFKCIGKNELAATEWEAIPVQVLSQRNAEPTEISRYKN